MSPRTDALTGSILGTALGDTLGLPFEGMSRRRVQRCLPVGSLSHRFLFGRGMVSDDTEHTCLVAHALAASHGDVAQFERRFASYLRWWLFGLPAGVGVPTSQVVSHRFRQASSVRNLLQMSCGEDVGGSARRRAAAFKSSAAASRRVLIGFLLAASPAMDEAPFASDSFGKLAENSFFHRRYGKRHALDRRSSHQRANAWAAASSAKPAAPSIPHTKPSRATLRSSVITHPAPAIANQPALRPASSTQ